MLALIHAPIADPNPALPEVALRVERLTIAKRIWRGQAEDGIEFGFELERPLRDGSTVFQSDRGRYVVRQNPEPVVEVTLEMAPSAAAAIGWAVGNLHLEFSAEPHRLLAPDEPAVRALFDRIKVPFVQTTAVFRPGHFARGVAPVQELGSSHRH